MQQNAQLERIYAHEHNAITTSGHAVEHVNISEQPNSNFRRYR